MNESHTEQMSLDAYEARCDWLHERWDRFHEAADLVARDSAEIFGEAAALLDSPDQERSPRKEAP